MRNSTSTRFPHLFGQKIFSLILGTAALLAPGLYSVAQNFVPVYMPVPTGIVDPAHPTSAPMQFTTNLVSAVNGSNTTVDGNITVLDDGFTNDIDGNDATKIVNANSENFALVRNNTDLVIEARKLVVTTDTLFYKMWNLKVQDYLLEFYPINMNKPGLTAVLVDRYLGTRSAVSLTTAPSYYNFSVSADAASAAQDRFILVLFQADAGPLPVSFISVAASKASSGVQLNWKVAGERAILKYNIERSADGSSFAPVGSVTATGSGYVDKDVVYGFKDTHPLAATVQYYRIKSIGVNGEAKYSPIVRVSGGDVKSAITLLTNPVKGTLNLQLTKEPKGKYDLILSSMDGKQVFRDYIQHGGETAVYPVALPVSVSRGTYILNVVTPEKVRQSQVVLVDQGN